MPVFAVIMENQIRFATIAFIAGLSGMAPRLCGQAISIGLIGGGSLTDAVQTQTNTPQAITSWSPHKDWIAGAGIEVGIGSRFALEVDGMYRELHATWAFVESNGTLNSVSGANVVTWEFPFLAKYRFSAGKLRPFVEAGPEYRATGNLNFNPSHLGMTAGFGVETRWRGLHIAPVLRYTRWRQRESPFVQSEANQLELMLAASRGSDSGKSVLGPRVSFGPVVGWGLTPDLPSSSNTIVGTFPDGNSYTQVSGTLTTAGVTSPLAGVAIEVALTRRLSIEIDVLDKPLRDRSTVTSGGQIVSGPHTGVELSTWEFPVLGKYYFRMKRVSPFVEAGPSFRLPNQGLSAYGLTAGGGVRMGWRAVHIAPALRFTRWAEMQDFRLYPRDEAAVLVSVLFGGARQ